MWVCVKTFGNEKRAAFHLEKQGLETFRPELHRFSVDPRTKLERKRELALFPGYVFVRLLKAADQSKASEARGVAYILGSWTGERFLPREMPIGWMTRLIDAGPMIEGKKVRFKKNDKVKLALNAIADVVADVDGLDDAGQVRVKFRFLGKSHVTTVAAERLAPVENSLGHCGRPD